MPTLMAIVYHTVEKLSTMMYVDCSNGDKMKLLSL